jgi:hypothetical protein
MDLENITKTLDGTEAWESILDELSTITKTEIYIVSAFIRSETLSKIANKIDKTNRVCIGVRWDAMDFIHGASDIHSYELAESKDWSFFAIPNLHTKAYLLGNKSLYIGSANLTNRGFGLAGPMSNKELLTRSSVNPESAAKVQGLFKNSIQIDKNLYGKIKDWLKLQENDTPLDLLGSFPIEHKLSIDLSTKVMLADCLTMTPTDILSNEHDPYDPIEAHNLNLLNIRSEEIDNSSLSTAFMNTLLFLWLKQKLENEEERTLYFGALSKKLHQTLKDDPSPRRKEIKDLLAILLRWVEYVPSCGIQVDRPNHSERVQLIKS